MEGLSAAASGIAVVSVAIQLAESFKKLSDFWKSIKEAPEDIRAISVDLELLSGVLVQIAHETQHVEPDATLIAILNGCCFKVKTFTTFLYKIEPGFASTSSRIRKWTAFKAVLKHGDLMKFQQALERLKSTLLLVQQNQSSRLSRNRQSSVERSLATISHNISSFSVQQHLEIAERISSIPSDSFRAEERDATEFCAGNMYLAQSDHSNSDGSWIVPRKQATLRRTLEETRSVLETFVGTIRATSTTTLQTSRRTGDLTPYPEQDQYEHKASFTIYPAPWMIRLGIRYGLHLGFLSSSTQGWKNTLKSVCPVPDDALIFEFCRQGNVPAVRSLLSGGHASVRDTDSQGHTPLHFAAENYHSELCAMLMGAGADMIARTHYAWTPIMLASLRAYKITQAVRSKAFDTFRLLIDSMEFSGGNDDGWDVLEDLCVSAAVSRSDICDLLLWTLQQSSFELKTNIIDERCNTMLYWTLMAGPNLGKASDLLLNLGGVGIIDVPYCGKDGYTILHQRLVRECMNELSVVVARGPDLHRLGIETYYTPYKESPTSLAMYSSLAFSGWLRALVNIDTDFENFIDQELEQNPEVHPGWGKETLLDLFVHGDRPELDFSFQNVNICSDCERYVHSARVQPYWRHLLERIKGSQEVGEMGTADRGGAGKAEPNTTRSLPQVSLDELPSEPESIMEEESSEYSATTSIQSDCMYGKHEIVCMGCWLYYEETGTRWQDAGTDEDSSETEDSLPGDASSEDEYSPFLIHS